MKRNTAMIITLVASIAINSVADVTNISELPIAKFTVKVVSEDLTPVGNANVSFGFGHSSAQGVTDANGLFTGEGHCEMSGIGSTINKQGYYLGFAATPIFRTFDKTLNQWMPWNETNTVILRRIGNPVALYAKKVQTDIPILDQPCGYDLEKGDWVAPFGNGVKSDFIFTVHKEYKNRFNFNAEAKLTFSEPGAGLLAMASPPIATNSIFRWDRSAPESGYVASCDLYITNISQKITANFNSYRRDVGYFFRVRTLRHEGQIVSAHYGKIVGDISLDPRNSKTCTVIFTYYFNPIPNDQNLEWDTKKNLFINLSFMQSPRDP
ncbi:MAG TPA: hypothetical protein VMH87_14185 [Pseudomonadales bacterium]|nr:hypothetical protein [Pseudomonadales bacterium]